VAVAKKEAQSIPSSILML